MFGQGNYATVWSREDKGKYSIVELSTSQKDKETGKYTTDFSSKYVRFIGEAHNKAAKYGLGEYKADEKKHFIVLGRSGVTTEKGKDGKWYTNFLVFDYELYEGGGSGGGAGTKAPDEPYEGDPV